MILLDGTEQEQEGELTPGRRINRYTDRGAAFRKPMAELEVGDILWDERTRTHWITDEVRYSKPDGNRADDGKGASLYISDGVRGRTFYESQSYYDSILVLSSPNVLLRYRTEALQREHELLLESEKPRNTFTVFSDSLRAGDSFLHPTRGWLVVESLKSSARSGYTGRTAQSYLITDGTVVSNEEIGSQVKILRDPEQPDMRDPQISEEDFDRILARASKNAELAVEEHALARKAQDSTRRPLQGSRPVTLNGAPGRAARIFFDELEEGDIVYWPGAGWQTVLSLVVSDTTEKNREVKVATLSNRVRVTPNLDTMLVDVFVPDSVPKTPQPSKRPGVELSSFQTLKSGETVLYGAQWRQIKKVHLGGAENVRTLSIVLDSGAKLTEQDFGPSVEVLALSTRRFPVASESTGAKDSQSPVFLWKLPMAVRGGERVLTVDGWIEVKQLSSKESAVYSNGSHWDSIGVDLRPHEVREFKTAKGISLVYAQVRSEDADPSLRQDGPVYDHDRLTSEAVVEGDEARTPAGSWLPLVKVEPETKRRGGVGRSYLAGYIGTFSYPDATQATGRLSVFEDSQGKLAYEIRRRLSSSDIKNLQKGSGA